MQRTAGEVALISGAACDVGAEFARALVAEGSSAAAFRRTFLYAKWLFAPEQFVWPDDPGVIQLTPGVSLEAVRRVISDSALGLCDPSGHL